MGVLASPPRTIVELGCGEGVFCRLLKNHFPEAKVTGLDFSESLIQIARARAEGVEYLVADFEKPTQVPNNSESDLVVSVFSFLEAESLSNAFASAKKLIATRGKFVLVITDPLVDLLKFKSGVSIGAKLGRSEDGNWRLTSSFVSEEHMPVGKYFRILRPIATYINEAAKHELVVCDFRAAATVRSIQSGGTELLIVSFCHSEHQALD
ncbi:MAG: class I SAM-dependent methyltransferase [Pirellulaceae bacterium]|nr:class I SAM-dependent methyltransferase [Pirellulaceae bacterium]